MITVKTLGQIGYNHSLAFGYLNSKFKQKDRNYRILDIGAGENFWSEGWTTHIIDKFIDKNDIHKVSRNDITIFNVDIDDSRQWEVVLDDVERHGKFDFVICSHTLEDVNNPKIGCEMINRIGKAGYISMPSKYSELTVFEYKSNVNLPYKGYHHHRWIYQIKDNTLVGYPKLNLYDYIDFEFDKSKAIGTEIAFLWEDLFDYSFIDCHELLDNRQGANKLYDLYEDDDLVLV